jgi:hypothetical protein
LVARFFNGCGGGIKMFLVFVTRFCNGVVNFVKVLIEVARGIAFGGGRPDNSKKHKKYVSKNIRCNILVVG